MTRKASLTIALFLFWLLLSGFFTPFLLAAGAGSAIAATFLAHRMDAACGGVPPFRVNGSAILLY